MVDLRLMIPKRRDDRPQWEVRRDEKVVGWVVEHTIGRSSAVFYRATAVHPDTGELVNLENSTDREERVARIEDFLDDPNKYRGIHWRPVNGTR
jgi:hypothetical protein